MKVRKKDRPLVRTADLMVKLTKLYNDIYIVRGRMIVAGFNPPDRILGTVMCTLKPEYEEALAEIISVSDLVYVADITETKKWLQEKSDVEEITDEIKEEAKKFFVKNEDKKEIERIRQKIEDFEEKFNPMDANKVRWWNCLSECEAMLESIFERKTIFDYPISIPKALEDVDEKTIIQQKTEIESGNEMISEAVTKEEDGTIKATVTMSTQLLPLITEKTVNNAYIGTAGLMEGQKDILEVLLDFHFELFRMMIVYRVIIVPPEDDIEN